MTSIKHIAYISTGIVLATVLIGIGFVVFPRQFAMIMFFLDARYWPNWIPSLLWIMVGITAFQTLLLWHFSSNTTVVNSTREVTVQPKSKEYFLSLAWRFMVFIILVEAWRQSGRSLETLFYPFAQCYKSLFLAYFNYLDYARILTLNITIFSWPFAKLPITLLSIVFLLAICWLIFGRRKGLSFGQFVHAIINGIGTVSLRICRLGLLGQLPVFYLAGGVGYFMFRILQATIISFYRKPLEYYMASGVLSWKLLFVPILIILLLMLTVRLLRKKKTNGGKIGMFLTFLFLLSVPGFAEEAQTQKPVPVPFREISQRYPHAKKISEKLYLLEDAEGVSQKSEDIGKTAGSESKLVSDGGYLANDQTVACFAAMAYDYTGGRYRHVAITFRLRMPPKIVPGKMYPLILHLHGKGESNDDNQRQLAHLQSAMNSIAGMSQIDCFILSPHCPADNKDWNFSLDSNDEKGDAPLVYTKEILDAVVDVFPIDKNRISTLGVCSGANASWDLATQYPNLFCALAATTISLPVSPERLGVLKHLNLWLFNNDNDKSSPIDPLYEARDILKTQGASVHLTVRSDGHNSWTKALKDDRIIAWLAEQKKGICYPPPGVVWTCKRTGIQILWQAIFPILIIVVLLVVQRRFAKRLRSGGVS